MPQSWSRQIEDARSPQQVAAIVRDYLAMWAPEELSLLPSACRPGHVRSAQDVDELHSRLVDEYHRDRARGAALSALQRLTNVIVHASVRIADLRGAGEEDPANESSSPTTRRASPASQA